MAEPNGCPSDYLDFFKKLQVKDERRVQDAPDACEDSEQDLSSSEKSSSSSEYEQNSSGANSTAAESNTSLLDTLDFFKQLKATNKRGVSATPVQAAGVENTLQRSNGDSSVTGSNGSPDSFLNFIEDVEAEKLADATNQSPPSDGGSSAAASNNSCQSFINFLDELRNEKDCCEHDVRAALAASRYECCRCRREQAFYGPSHSKACKHAPCEDCTVTSGNLETISTTFTVPSSDPSDIRPYFYICRCRTPIIVNIEEPSYVSFRFVDFKKANCSDCEAVYANGLRLRVRPTLRARRGLATLTIDMPETLPTRIAKPRFSAPANGLENLKHSPRSSYFPDFDGEEEEEDGTGCLYQYGPFASPIESE